MSRLVQCDRCGKVVSGDEAKGAEWIITYLAPAEAPYGSIHMSVRTGDVCPGCQTEAELAAVEEARTREEDRPF